LTLDDKIKFHGARPHEYVNKMMNETDFFIQHSKRAESGDCEGLPNAIIEALILNKPVISTNHSGIPEIVQNGVNGFLTEEGNILATRDKILEAVNHDFRFQQLDFLRLENSIKKLASVLNE
jgi:glycosyltransferase involved in cell wall biosynthesis